MSITLNKKEIEAIIPMRDPMLLIDSVIDLVQGESIRAKYYISPQMEILKGHFPDKPVLPGVYTAECLAQASDILILSSSKYQGTIPYLIGLDKIRFMAPISPGDTIIIESKVIHEREDKAILTCFAEVKKENEEKVVAEGEVTLAMR